jgi:hypothetical protein
MIDLTDIVTHQTNGINCDITTEDIIEKLTRWDKLYGIEISEVENDQVVVKFSRLPNDLEALASEIYEFCPDVIDQGYGCMDDILAMKTQSGTELDEETQTLIQGVDFNDENFGLKILQNDLRLSQKVFFWWD